MRLVQPSSMGQGLLRQSPCLSGGSHLLAELSDEIVRTHACEACRFADNSATDKAQHSASCAKELEGDTIGRATSRGSTPPGSPEAGSVGERPGDGRPRPLHNAVTFFGPFASCARMPSRVGSESSPKPWAQSRRSAFLFPAICCPFFLVQHDCPFSDAQASNCGLIRQPLRHKDLLAGLQRFNRCARNRRPDPSRLFSAHVGRDRQDRHTARTLARAPGRLAHSTSIAPTEFAPRPLERRRPANANVYGPFLVVGHQGFEPRTR